MPSIRKRISFISAAAVLAVGLAGVYVSAQDGSDAQRPPAGRRGGPGGRFGGPGDLVGGLPLGRLGLSDAQREQVRAARQSHQEELRALGDRARTAQQGLHAAITAESVDEGLIRARAAELAAVEADLAVLRARIHAEVFRILTPEQQAQFRQMESQRQERIQNRRERAPERRQQR